MTNADGSSQLQMVTRGISNPNGHLLSNDFIPIIPKNKFLNSKEKKLEYIYIYTSTYYCSKNNKLDFYLFIIKLLDIYISLKYLELFKK